MGLQDELAERRIILRYPDYEKKVFSTQLNESVIALVRSVAKISNQSMARWIEDRLLYSITDAEFEAATDTVDERLKELGAVPEANIGADFDVDEMTQALDDLEETHETME